MTGTETEGAVARVGFVGLGNMGAPMARRLAAARYEVTGYDPSNSAGAQLAGMDRFARAASLAEVAKAADFVVLMLPNSAVVRQVLVEDDVLGSMKPGALVVDMSSSQPDETRRLAEEARRRGVRMVDAPVSGGVSAAQDGTLAIMAGGPAAWVAECEALLQQLGTKLVHAGPAGAGHALKALNNLLSASHLVASSEALVIGMRFGLDPYVMMDAINGSSGRSGSTMTKWPRYILPETFDSGFLLRLMLKDAQIAAEMARGSDIHVPHTAATVALWERAADSLPPDADHTEIHRWAVREAGATDG